ncbi:uncharacterized protein [Nicotiana tomentosiformis]|uniref:uncharacterized protein n=1 Tax=Nicotiana tomentosiformis TaxID=4098 RepID=UPI00388CE50F
MPKLPRLEWKGWSVSTFGQVISSMKSRHMVEKGYLSYPAYVQDTTVESPVIDSVPVVREFSDVFPSDLLGMSPYRDINFCIDLAPAPLTRLTQKGAQFHCFDDYEMSFQKLKTTLTTAPVLVLPSGSGMYTMYCNASRVGLGCIVMQEGRFIAYASCQLKPHEKHYPIKARQFDNPHLTVLRETVLHGSAKEVSISEDGVMRLQGCLYVPNVDGLRERILKKAHSSRYSIHPGVTKMYRNLRHHYWWRQMKKDIVEYRAVQSELGTRVELNTTFHPQTDEQLEWTVQILEDMLRACVIDFGGQWDRFLPLTKFSYNNSYQSSIEMAPYEALYGRRFPSPIGWFASSEAKLYGTDLVKDVLE